MDITQPSGGAVPEPRPRHGKATPFSRHLKGLFLFVVALVIASQVPAVVLLNRLISREEERLVQRLKTVASDLRHAWLITPPGGRDGIDLKSAAIRHNIRDLWLCVYNPDTLGGRWLFRSVQTGHDVPQDVSILLSEPPATADLGFSGNSEDWNGYIAETWGNQTVLIGATIASPIVASLKRQRRFELALRGVVLAGFLLFTVLFYRAVLLPFHDMRRRAAALIRTGLLPPAPNNRDRDPEYVMATYDLLVQQLLAQTDQLKVRAAQSERHSRNLERFNDYILSSMTTGVIILNRQGAVLRFNRAAERILHLSAEAITGRGYRDTNLPEPLLDVLSAGLEQGEITTRRELFVPRNGDEETIYLGVSTSCIRNEDEEIVGLSVLLSDLTEIKRLQDEVAENQRLADLGEMAAGLAHQLRNSIAAIFGYGRMLNQTPIAAGQHKDWVDGIVTEARETSDMIGTFLEFARPLHGDRHPVNLLDVIDAGVRSAKPVLERSQVTVHVQNHDSETGAVVQGDDLLLKQVFLNLIHNAAEASLPGGSVEIALRKVAAEGGRLSQWTVAVTDHGDGVPPADQRRIFHPFFTTKESGTGLGLPLARKIAVYHGGTLTLPKSGPDGSTFVVTLPACPTEQQAISDITDPQVTLAARHTIRSC